MEEIMITKRQVLNATLELCDVIVADCELESERSRNAPIELCESIVAECELRAQSRAFGDTYIGRMVRSGVKVRLENKTLHEGNAFAC